jgi:uncharacterized membrane protein YfcA
VPLLALLLPMKVVVPMVVMLDLVASCALVALDVRAVNFREIVRLLPFGVIGALLGTAAFLHYPSRALIVLLGPAAVSFGVIIGWRQPRAPVSGVWAVPAALIGSSSGALFGMPYIVYLAQRLIDKNAVRATFSSLFVLDGGLRAALMAAEGMITLEVEAGFALGLVPMAAGLYLGNRVHGAATPRTLFGLLGASLVAGGAYLVLA